MTAFIGAQPFARASRQVVEFTASNNQTVFNTNYTPGLIDVYKNGVLLNTSQYTASNGTSITLNSAAVTSDSINIVKYSSFEVAASVASITYTHNQEVASSTWSITHTLNKYPSVTIVDSAGTVVVGDITYIDASNIIIDFDGTSFSGKAYLN
jgi:hypothetical protein